MELTKLDVQFLIAAVQESTIKGSQAFFVGNLLQKLVNIGDGLERAEQESPGQKPAKPGK